MQSGSSALFSRHAYCLDKSRCYPINKMLGNETVRGLNNKGVFCCLKIQGNILTYVYKVFGFYSAKQKPHTIGTPDLNSI